MRSEMQRSLPDISDG
jgi:hypothetical protein